MARILVTGGAGFVGSNLASKLIEEHHQVFIIDDFSNGLESNLSPHARFLRANLSESNWRKELQNEDFDVVIHCAAQSSNATSFKNPMRDLLDNLLATQQVIKYCEEQSIRRVIFTSSMSVYGNTLVLPTPVDTTPNPETIYALHKATAEGYFKLHNNLDWTIFRLYTTYGAGQNLENREQGLVKIYLAYILKGEPVVVHGSGDRIRDIIHVSDVVNAIYLSIFNFKTFRQIYNLGSGQTIQVKQIIEHLYDSMGIFNPPRVIYEGPDVGDPTVTYADISKTKKDLGWNPRINATNGITMTVSKYKKHSD